MGPAASIADRAPRRFSRSQVMRNCRLRLTPRGRLGQGCVEPEAAQSSAACGTKKGALKLSLPEVRPPEL